VFEVFEMFEMSCCLSSLNSLLVWDLLSFAAMSVFIDLKMSETMETESSSSLIFIEVRCNCSNESLSR